MRVVKDIFVLAGGVSGNNTCSCQGVSVFTFDLEWGSGKIWKMNQDERSLGYLNRQYRN